MRMSLRTWPPWMRTKKSSKPTSGSPNHSSFKDGDSAGLLTHTLSKSHTECLSLSASTNVTTGPLLDITRTMNLSTLPDTESTASVSRDISTRSLNARDGQVILDTPLTATYSTDPSTDPIIPK